METARLFIPYLGPQEFAEIARDIAEASPRFPWWRQQSLCTENAVAVCALVEKREYVDWGRLLSAESGGFCVAQPDANTPPAVFYSGESLETGADDTWEDWYLTLCEAPWSPELAEFPGGARLARRTAPASERHWTRAAFANTDAVSFTKAVDEALAAGFAVDNWRWLARQTSLAELSFVMLERGGACEVALLQFLAKRLDTNATALEFRPRSRALGWWLNASGVLDCGEAPLASDVADFCTSLCITMGEAAGQLRWPRREPGRALDPSVTYSEGIAR